MKTPIAPSRMEWSSSMLILKDSFHSRGAHTFRRPQIVDKSNHEEVQASIEALASAMEAEGQAIEAFMGTQRAGGEDEAERWER